MPGQINLSNFGAIVEVTVENLWIKLIQLVPAIIGAIIIFIIGLIIASILGSVVRKLLRATGIDRLFERTNIRNRMNMRVTISGIVGSVVKWFIIIATIVSVADILQLPQINNFLNQILLYIPNVAVAIIILVMGAIAAEFLGDLVRGLVQGSGMKPAFADTVSTITRYALLVFTVMAALTQLKVVPQLIEILFGGMVLAAALAIGLGSKDHVNKWIENMKSKPY